MTIRDMLDRIAGIAQCPVDVPTAPPIDLIAFVVRWNRSLRQWKLSTLADFARVSVSTVERVERGEKVSDKALDNIAQAFGYGAGYFTEPRLPGGADDAAASLIETYGYLEPVPVTPMKTHRAVRDAARCSAFLIHRPEVPDTYDADIENLLEWLDLASFVLSDLGDGLPSSERGRRDLYNEILTFIQELERRGLSVLSGVLHAPQEGLPDWKIAIVSVSPKLTDPGAPKRRHIMVDRRVFALPAAKAAM